ncbi:glycosyltransferase [bacterium]|nr:glycosyltransferase [bacterium]
MAGLSFSPGQLLWLASVALAVLGATSCLYYVLAALAALRTRKALSASQPTGARPRVSVLVPVSGKETRLRANLEAILRSLEPGDELLVGAALAEDPALEIVSELARSLPKAPLIVVAGSASRATNRKVAALEALERRASADVLLLVDSDVRLDAGLIEGLVRPLGQERVGLATALYRGVPAPGAGLAPRLEALTINADFVPSVLVAHFLGGGMSFALGAANAVRREALEAIGGFASLGEVLADDHELGRRVAAAGFRVKLAPAVVPIVQDSSWKETLARLLRWSRTYRVCRPLGYAATVLSHHGIACSLGAVALALAASAASGAIALPVWALALAGTVVLVRLATAGSTHALIAGKEADFASLPLLPLRDILGTALFLLAWTRRTVTWRSRRYRVSRDGTMTALEPVTATLEVAALATLPEPEAIPEKQMAAPLAAPGGS